MPADVSRVSFDPRHHHASVLMQQGRVLLDADWNEYASIVERRFRAAAVDVASFGPDPDHAGTAWVPRQTVDGFRVTAASGAISIGRGRMYVDGLLAENHGVAPFALDPVMGELRGTADTPYTEQPYWPAPSALPTGGTHLAYLDVWERELTHLEAPELIEPAVGVDTTARRQVVWQVRLLPDVGSVTCDADDDDIPGWLNVIRPSDGRLTTGTVEVDDEEDPCLLPPTGGYRGLENQTYRVEIHAGGAPGTATFKWSRDNGSVAVPVVEMVTPTVLRVATVGRDDVLRISTGDWVEVIDDNYELAQRPGELRKVTVDDAARTVTFAPALPADLQPASADDAADRHLRVRRWDQRGVVRDAGDTTIVDLDQPGASGVITVPASATTQVLLEHGVAVSFSVAVAGGRFRAGDHWVFAARTNDTSVELLDAAPPLGVHHHYARLAVVTLPGSVTDCRRIWPPLDTGGDTCGDCSACVTPESHASGALTIQAAIDQHRERGGTVCLHEGTYDVGPGVLIERATSLRLRGQGPATVLVARGTALTVRRSRGVFLERFAVLGGSASPAAVRLHTTMATMLDQVAVLSHPSEGEKAGGPALQLAGACMGVTVRECVLVGTVGIDSSEAASDDKTGALVGLMRVVDTEIVGRDGGVQLSGTTGIAMACRIEGNDVLARGGTGIAATGIVEPGGSLSIAGNRLAAQGTGIEVGPDAAVRDNTVRGVRERPGVDGIVVVTGELKAPPGNVVIEGNRVHDRAGDGIALRGPVRSISISGNVVTGARAGIVAAGRGRAARLVVERNEVADIAGGEDELAVGIGVLGAASVTIAGNHVRGVGRELVEARLRCGILVAAADEVGITGNSVDQIGPAGEHVGLAAGILASGPFGVVRACGNAVRDGVDPEARRMRRWSALLVQSAGSQVTSFSRNDAVVPSSNGAVLVSRDSAAAAEGADHVTVTDNDLRGGSGMPTCLVTVAGDVVATGNQCEHDPSGEPVAMLVRAGLVTASSNRMRSGKAGLVLDVPENRFAAVANLAPGGTHLGGYGNGLPGPWDALNPNA